MKTFFLIRYCNGAVVRSIQAENEKKAHEILQDKGFDTQNDNYIDTNYPQQYFYDDNTM